MEKGSMLVIKNDTSIRRTLELVDEEIPSQSTPEERSVPLTRSRRLSQLLPEFASLGAVPARPTKSKKKEASAPVPYRKHSNADPSDAVEPPTMAAAETRPMKTCSTQPPSMTRRVDSTRIAAHVRMRISDRLHGGMGSQGSSRPPVVIDLAELESELGVRCS
ncbi:hypothetical protein CJ030_MR8G006781 [Morella rubra]|uniref:Uncharacterized protein n=1 Tax=Morella rubra TaxID=262757 RepID=A0A6A1US78_9ROSI|nr:hypothetical protein CJ030_MR8G006781 [Morella rubra]